MGRDIKPVEAFRTHGGEVVTGERLQAALAAVADDWAALAERIRQADNYAPHVSEQTKDDALKRSLAHAERIRAGHVESLTIAQRLNTKLTGQCIALLK